MHAAWLRFLKSAYRQEPIASFVVTVGAVDAAIGGVEQSASLFGFGITVVSLALALRWWQLQRSRPTETEKVPEHYLPASSSRQPLPMLMSHKKHPPH
ncbi:hypothetical protein [Phormidium sp. CCY1219]|uniref:hypothetical protein n=1 Tax=Phormidium sp. CCY1219 TaxID=2886104 RepID=UPI002D1F89FB|nr:hypothetical protein [Phormidium sp. CCY1219]MEB3831202.1 hypothetical protein [Phormidium sp. CCY1219]